MRLRKEIAELLEAGIIDSGTANRINEYYNTKSGTPQSKLLIVFGIFGALLVGLGIILILAHNWDDLNRGAKTVIAFLPLLLGQVICGYSLLKKYTSTTWREASSAFLFIAIGACISLISQIYNISGSMSAFMLTWMLLALPIIYVMRSSVASLFFIAGITWYACEVGYWNNAGVESYLYWGLLVLVLPYYYLLYRNKRESNFFTFHNWFIPISVIIALGTIATDAEELMLIAYVSLFGLLYLIGNQPVLRDQKIRNNGYLVLGSLGTVAMLLGLSFDFFWSDLRQKEFDANEWLTTPEFLVTTLLTLSALVLFIYQKMKQKTFDLRPVEPVFILFIIIFFIGLKSPAAIAFINLLVLMIGIMTIREGAKQYNLGVLNYGLMIITALVICRFFDTDLGFVLKGILFVAVGIGFFLANYMMIKRKREVIVENSTEPSGLNENIRP